MHLKFLLFSGFLISFFTAFSQSTDPTPYCASTYHNQDATIDNHITEVTLNTLTAPSGDNDYTNNTGLFTNLDLGSTYTLNVTLSGTNTQGVGAWIDFNQNEIFEDHERIMNIVNSGGLTGVQQQMFTVPTGAYNGVTRIRIRSVIDTLFFLDNAQTNMVPCESPYTTTLAGGGPTTLFANGETEDYSIIFSGGCVSSEANTYSFNFNNKNYDIISERMSWDDAAACAKNRGGHLAQLEHQPEHQAVFTEVLGQGIETDSTMASSGSGFGYLWLGGSDKTQNLRWVWDGDNDGFGEPFWQGGNTGTAILDLFNAWDLSPSSFAFRDALGLSLETTFYGDEGSFVDLNSNNELYFVVEYPETGVTLYDYCESKTEILPSNTEFHISSVLLEDIDTISTHGGYVNFYDVITDIDAGLAYTGTFTLSETGAQGIAVWIDYNNDNIFEDNELIGQEVNASGLPDLVFNFGFNVPLTAVLSKTKMRVKAVKDFGRFNSDGDTWVSPCDSYEEGETEDYTINIVDQGLGDTPAVIVTSTNNVLSITQNAQTLQMIVQTNPTVEPVVWSVTSGTGDALIDNNGLLSPIANGTVTVVATSIIGGNPVEGSLSIEISNQAKFITVEAFSDTAISLCNGQNGTYVIDVDLKEGFANPINFTLTGVPTGANFTITPPSLTGDGQVTVTINNVNAPFIVSDLVFNGSIPGTIISEDLNLVLKTFNGNPFFTSLLLPINNAVSVPQLPFLDWTESLRADWYELEISTSLDFSNIVFTENNIVNSELSPVFNFLINQDYYWRVKPHNPCGSLDWTAGYKFTIQPYGGIQGCTDSDAINYNSAATIENGSCIFPSSGCTDTDALNYDATAVVDNGTCNFDILMINIQKQTDSVYKFSLLDDGSSGMVDGISWNFFDGQPLTFGPDRLYSFDSNGTFAVQMKAYYPVIDEVYTIDTTIHIQAYGCTDPFALNYNINAVYDIGNCIAKVFGCTNPLSTNYNANANVDNGTCSVVIMGCTDIDAFNYNASATNDDGSCIEKVFGCTDATALNYDVLANTDNGTCIPTILGCMDTTAFNYNPDATVNDGSCEAVYTGCTDEDATNFVSYANTDDGSCLFTIPNGNDWQVNLTSENHSILLQSSIDISEVSPSMVIGDYLGVFYTKDDGTEQCAGRIEWNGTNAALTAYGTEDGLDNGFAINENFTWKIWRKENNQTGQLSAEYDASQTNQGAYVNDGISSVLKLGTGITQNITLNTGWNFISSNLSPLNSSIDSIFSTVNSDLFLAKDELGNVYWPSIGINNIGDHIIGEAYKVNMNADAVLEIKGISLSPENYDISLNEGWSYIGYIRDATANVASVMNSVSSNIFIMKNINGDVYWPQFGINNLGNMEVGKGYQINMSNDTIFKFPSNETVLPSLKVMAEMTPETYSGFDKSSRHMHIAIPIEAWDSTPEKGSEVGVFIEGNLVGSSVYNNGNMVVSVYGDDLKTLDNKVLNFKVLENGEEANYELTSIKSNSLVFEENDAQIAKNFKKKSKLNILTEFTNQSNLQISFIEEIEESKNILINVSDYLGRVIYSRDLVVNENDVLIELPLLDKGNYIINISENGSTIETLKWLK